MRSLRLILPALIAVLLLAPAASADGDGPQVEIATPADGWAFFQGQQVRAGYGCFPGAAGWPVISCEGDVQLGAYIDTSNVGVHTFSVHAVDFSGAETTVSHTYTVFDVIPPVAAITTPADGAVYPVGAQLLADYSCDDGGGGSGISGCIGTYPVGYPLPTARPGIYTFTVDAFDGAANHGSTSVTYRLADLTPPWITITSPADGAQYRFGDPLTASFSCHDDVDGSSVSCKATPLDTSPGAHSFRVDSVDASGNRSSATAIYTVVYPFDGFASPLVAEPAATTARAGDALPAKFSLGGDRGLDVVTRAAWRPCATATNDSSAAQGSLNYSTHPDRYTFMWSTDRSWAGSCKELILRMRDGTTHGAFVMFR